MSSIRVPRRSVRPAAPLATVAPLICAIVTFICATRAGAQENTPTKTRHGVEFTLYPILVEAPIFGATINLPSLPSGGGGEGGSGGGDESGAQSGSTDIALNAAYMAGLNVRTDRFFGELRGQWAAVSADRQTPRINVHTDAYFFYGRAGVRLFDGLSVTGGFRRVSVKLDTTLTLTSLDRVISGTMKPVLWDPMIGVDWHRAMGRWVVEGSFEGGGFGVGTDADVNVELHAGWRIIPHTELRLGYGLLYYKLTVADVSIGSFQRTLVSSQTLHGPSVGFGIVF
jgi:hypothetical protein